MILDLFFLVIGLVGLYYGSEFLVKGAARLAGLFGVPPLVIGLTVVAYGTSAPELLVSTTAALQGNPEVSIGNVVGSNISNIALILGITGLILPINVNASLIKREIPFLIVISIITYIFARSTNEIGRLEGFILFLGAVGFTIVSYMLSSKEDVDIQAEAIEFDEVSEYIAPDTNTMLEFGRVILGILILVVGAQATVEGAINIATEIGISKVVISLTMIALGTSLPELATSIVAALNKESDIFVGNIIGSSVFNLLWILGATSMIEPISIVNEVIWYDMPLMIFFTVLILPLSFNLIINRVKAGLLLVLYASYIAFLFLR